MFSSGERNVNLHLLEEAQKRVPFIPVLVNMCSKRVRQLNAGYRPYVRTSGGPHEEKIDIALREIAEGTLIVEMTFSEADEKTE